MQEHWPILIAIMLISAAASLGLWQQQTASDAARSRPLMPPIAAAASMPSRSEKPNGARPPAPASPPRPAAPVEPIAPMNIAPAVEVPIRPAPSVAITRLPVAPLVVPPGAPTAPAAPLPPKAPIDTRTRAREQQLMALRNALQQQMGILPMQTAGDGFAVSFDGGRIEVQPVPQWSITIYNVNGAAPETETENFKKCMDIVIRTFGIDMTQRFADAANGTRNMLTSSSMGRIQVSRDPAQGNSCTIKPLDKLKPPTPAGAVAPPAAPLLPPPAAPQLAPRPAPLPTIPAPLPEKKPSTDAIF